MTHFDKIYQFGLPEHHAWLRAEAMRQFSFFASSPRPGGGFHLLDHDGSVRHDRVQELHTTTRLVHSYALGKLAGFDKSDAIIDQGMGYLFSHHRDDRYGGYLWALKDRAVEDDRKLAYGHVFVLLAGASAKMVGHPDADRLIDDVTEVLQTRFWEEDAGLFADEWNRDWTPFSTYRGMNANMHGVEALLTAFEATGQDGYLQQAGRILDFFIGRMALAEQWRLPEHYRQDWTIDRDYAGDPMFRPAGTTPGHSFELARLLLQHWDLSGRPDDVAPNRAWSLTDRALSDAWDQRRGGLFYTLDFGGSPAIRDRYWWPVTEAIGVLASFLKLGGTDAQRDWYARLWQFADAHFIDQHQGGWHPEIDEDGQPSGAQFTGKPDIYHSIQATLFPLTSRLSYMAKDLTGRLGV